MSHTSPELTGAENSADQGVGAVADELFCPIERAEARAHARAGLWASSLADLGNLLRIPSSQICRPTLFETMTIEDSDGLESLLGVAQTVHLAGLVK